MKKSIAETICITAVIAVLIVMNKAAKMGAAEGISMCENIIIPSLLPVLILTGIIQNSQCSIVFEKLFGAVFEKVFHLPRCCCTAVILGLIGGFPCGGVLTQNLYVRGYIDEKTAQRVMCFNFCGGLAFIVTAVGSVNYGSTKTGLILYCVNVISSLTAGVITALFCREKIINIEASYKHLPLSDALVKSTENCIYSLLVMSAYIVLFSAVCSVFSIPEYIYPLIEITKGICSPVSIPLDYCAFFLAFGGFCIHFQLMGILRSFKMNYFKFFIYRIFCGVLSFFLMRGYACIFPESISVFSNVSHTIVEPYQVNTGLSVVMVIGCAVIIFDIENRKLDTKRKV